MLPSVLLRPFHPGSFACLIHADASITIIRHLNQVLTCVPDFEIRCGDSLTLLRQMPSESVNCVVTSPPFYGLRDYGTGTWEGGDPECQHTVRRWDGEKQTQGAQSGHASKLDKLKRSECVCGAKRIDQQIGLEPTPEEYVARLLEVFREVHRVLKDDGSLWLNLGDSYSSQGGPEPKQTKWQVDGASNGQNGGKTRSVTPGLKPKDLIGIPWMTAFALRDDGWYLRSDIIWSKPNAFPSSVKDRPTNSHEHIFLLTKSPKYFYDHEAVREAAVSDHKSGNGFKRDARLSYRDANGAQYGEKGGAGGGYCAGRAR